MYTRQDYMSNKCTHREYYAQFVNEFVKQVVLNKFSKQILEKSYARDEHFNDKLTPLKVWDLMGGFAFSNRTGAMTLRPTTAQPINHKLLEEANEGYSSSTAVCVYKEAARQIISK